MTGESSTLGRTARGVPITLDLADRLNERAWEVQGRTASDVVREALAKALAAKDIRGWGDDPGGGPRRLAFIIPDETWAAIKTLAFNNRMSMAAAVRIAIARELGTK